MNRQPCQKLTLAELLIVLALVGIALGLARPWWHAWKAEEWTLAVASIIAWLLGVGGVRAVFCRAVLPAGLLCAAAAIGVAVYFKLSWSALLIVVGTAIIAAISTAAFPWWIARGGSWLAMLLSGKSSVSRMLLLGFTPVIIAVSVAAALVWSRDPAVSTTVIRRFEYAKTTSSSASQNRQSLSCVSSGGRFLALTNDSGVEILDVQSGVLRPVPNSSRLEVVALSTDGRFLGCWQRDAELEPTGIAFCVDTGTGARLVELRVRYPFQITFDAANSSFVVGRLLRRRSQLEKVGWRLQPKPEVIERWQFECPEGGDLDDFAADCEYGVVDYATDDPMTGFQTVTRWQLWKLSPPAELILDSKDKEFPSDLDFHANGEWFASSHDVWNRDLTSQRAIDATVLGIEPASKHLAVLRYNGKVGPPFPRVGLSDELMQQLPFWRLLNDPAEEVQFWVYDLRDPSRIWQSSAASVRPWMHWNSPVFDMMSAPDGSAFALQDDAGKIILWRIHRSPFPGH
jgi:Tfp pilus assembly protein FimT